jgi:IS605 OrfB family transposase
VVGSDGTSIDLSRVARLQTEYGIRRRDFSLQHPNDRRLVRKYTASSREKERVNQVLHQVAKQIVRKAKENKQALVLEQLKGIRFSHLRDNGDGISQRRRISQWPLARFVSYVGYTAV